jgi:hypothetical protein
VAMVMIMTSTASAPRRRGGSGGSLLLLCRQLLGLLLLGMKESYAAVSGQSVESEAGRFRGR